MHINWDFINKILLNSLKVLNSLPDTTETRYITEKLQTETQLTQSSKHKGSYKSTVQLR